MTSEKNEDMPYLLYKKLVSGGVTDRSYIVELFTELGRKSVNAERTSFWRWDKENHTLVTSAATGSNTIVINENTGLVGLALREKRVVITNDPYSSPYFNSEVDKKNGFLTKSILVMPIANDEGEIIGAFQAINKEGDANGFDEERDCKKLSIAAVICGLVLESRLMRNEKEISEGANRAKSSFLANMSHEIRTPLNAILGMDEIILRESNEESTISYAADIQTAGKTLLALINDILDFSKIEEGKLEIIPTQYDVGVMANDLINLVSERASKKGLKLDLKFDETVPGVLYGDEIRIKQCALNILINAVKYTEKGSVCLEMSHIVKDDDNIALRIKVSDTGIGMKKEDMNKLFTPFTRIEEKRNRNIEGTGLGMSITLQLLSLMDSHLEVESEYGKGSVFSFVVDQKIVDHTPVGNLHDHVHKKNNGSNDGKHIEAKGAKILVVDDNSMNIKVFKGLLKKSGADICEALSGVEALAKMSSQKFDLVFLDHKMPGMDGIEVMHRIKADKSFLNADTPVIALTANAINGAREMYIAEGFSDFLTKPIQVEKLEEMIASHLPEGSVTYKESDKKFSAKVLVVDDNPMNRKVFIGLMSGCGIDITEAESGKKGFWLIKNNKYDIIFLDHMMPEIDGIELMHMIREDKDSKNADTPTIVVTANAIMGARESYLAEGFDDYISKPINKDAIVSVLDRYLGIGAIDDAETNDKHDESKATDESFPEIEGMDWNFAMGKLHDASLLRTLLLDYIGTGPEDGKELQEYFNSLISALNERGEEDEIFKEALSKYEIKVHAMKSSAAMIGATGISYLAKLLEYASKDGNTDRIKSLMPVYMAEREKNLELLSESFKTEEDVPEEGLEEIDPMFFKQYLDMLKDAIGRLDVDTSDSIIEELHGYRYSNDIKGLLKKLGAAVRDLDKDKVNSLADEIKDCL